MRKPPIYGSIPDSAMEVAHPAITIASGAKACIIFSPAAVSFWVMSVSLAARSEASICFSLYFSNSCGSPNIFAATSTSIPIISAMACCSLWCSVSNSLPVAWNSLCIIPRRSACDAVNNSVELICIPNCALSFPAISEAPSNVSTASAILNAASTSTPMALAFLAKSSNLLTPSFPKRAIFGPSFPKSSITCPVGRPSP